MSRSYPRYRGSGVEWLGDVPAHWEVARLKWSIAETTVGVWGDEPDGENDIACVRVADFDRRRLRVNIDSPTLRAINPKQRIGRQLLSGDLLLEKSGGGDRQMVGCVVYFDHDEPAVCSNFIARLVSAPDASPEFWTYVHAAIYAGKLNYPAIKQTTGIQNLDAGAYFDTLVVFPPLDEQCEISAFLDGETERIDALVEKKRLLIERLAEYRTALITRTITRGLPPEAARAAGLDPSPRLKPSGVEWLGDMPEHWEVKRLRFVASTNDEALSDGEGFFRPISYVDIGSVDATFGVIRKEEMFFGHAPSRARRLVRDGDTIVSTVRTYLRAIAPIHSPSPHMVVSTGFAVVRPFAMSPGFCSWVLRERGFVDQIVARSVGVSYPAINASRIGDIPVPLPPPDEQKAIARLLDRETKRLDALVERVETHIERLLEQRTALISAAVTGKISVSEAAQAPVAAGPT